MIENGGVFDGLRISISVAKTSISPVAISSFTVSFDRAMTFPVIRRTNSLRTVDATAYAVAFSSDLKTNYVGKRVYYFEDIDSTQNFALQISSNKKENGTLVIAEKQNDGKGRMNRKWFTPKGGISFSVIIHPNFNISDSKLRQKTKWRHWPNVQ